MKGLLVILNVALGALSARVEVEQHGDGFRAHMQRVRQRGWQVFASNGRNDDKSQHYLDLLVAVKQQNVDKLESVLISVSDPKSPTYGKHLSKQEVDTLLAPSAEAVTVVKQWLENHGVEATSVTANSDFIRARVTVSHAENILNATYVRFEHDAHPPVWRVGGDASYSVPVEVAQHVDFIAPTISFPGLKVMAKRSKDTAAKVTPTFLRSLYGMTKTDVGTGKTSNITQGVASFIEQYYDPKDLPLFFAKYKQPADTPFTDVPVLQKHSPVGVEASIDSEYICALGSGISTEMWYTVGVQPGNPENEPFVEWLTAVAADATPPSVFSISYGDDENGVTKTYADRSNTEFQKAGVRGLSLLVASGDSGAGCASGAFVPTFPACSPWITAVGGLEGGTAGKFPTGETTAALSGGGFSNYFDRPAYQDTAVALYLKQADLPAAKMYNKNGAGFPDISAQALQFDTCSAAFFYPYDGTSCATPTVAGMVAMFNQIRMDAGKSPMGFLNPFIYTQAAVGFTDVMEGKNNYCDNAEGFPATKGWDAATGYGSPSYSQLKPFVLALP